MKYSKESVINKAQSMIGNRKLLYLVEYGSSLYGTDTPESDLDLRGIFLPNLDDLYLCNSPKEFNYTTGNDKSRNNNEDVDIKLFSLQKFIGLVREGDTNALDLYFAESYPSKVIYKADNITPLLNQPEKLINMKDMKAFIGYAIGQAKRYGIKGSRLGVVKNIRQYLNTLSHDYDNHIILKTKKLCDIVDDILKNYYDESYCFKKFIKDSEYLIVCGSKHQLNITLKEFKTRIDRSYESYGWRTEEAAIKGVDWKALSHAVRALHQIIELYGYGKITFPLQGREYILKIKQGNVPFDEVEYTILNLLEQADNTKNNSSLLEIFKYDNDFVINMLRSFYTGSTLNNE